MSGLVEVFRLPQLTTTAQIERDQVAAFAPDLND
jgi:hypothetical protein